MYANKHYFWARFFATHNGPSLATTETFAMSSKSSVTQRQSMQCTFSLPWLMLSSPTRTSLGPSAIMYSHYVFTLNRHLQKSEEPDFHWPVKLFYLGLWKTVQGDAVDFLVVVRKINWLRTSLWFVYLLINETCKWQCRWMGSASGGVKRTQCDGQSADTMLALLQTSS